MPTMREMSRERMSREAESRQAREERDRRERQRAADLEASKASAAEIARLWNAADDGGGVVCWAGDGEELFTEFGC